MAKTVTYDPEVIQEFADSLYSRARSIITSHTLLGLFVGAVLGLIIGIVSGTQNVAIIAIAAGLTAIFGFSLGREKAFKLKLEAQIALCQVQIEKNTTLKILENGN
jgi:hypothetical protein